MFYLKKNRVQNTDSSKVVNLGTQKSFGRRYAVVPYDPITFSKSISSKRTIYYAPL
jgi:hypothetical protein